MKRREFIGQSLTLLCASSVSQFTHAFNNYSKDSAVSKTPYVVWAEGTVICRKNLNTGLVQKQYIGAACHGILPVPGKPHQFFTIEKWRRRLVRMDFENPANIQKYIAHQSFRFYGHAAILPDQKHIIVLTVNSFSKNAHLMTFEIDTLKLVDDYIIGVGGGHEMSLLPDNRFLVVAMTGWSPNLNYDNKPTNNYTRIGNSNLTFVDLISRRVVEVQELKDDRISLAHLKVLDDGRIYAISDIMHDHFNRLGAGGVHFTKMGSRIQNLQIPTEDFLQLKGEFLSVDVNINSNIVAATNPYGKKIAFFDAKNNNSFIGLANCSANGLCWNKDGTILYTYENNRHDGYDPILQKKEIVSPHDSFSIVQVRDRAEQSSSHMYYYER